MIARAPEVQVPELTFRVESASAVKFAAVPTLAFRLDITNATSTAVESLALHAQVRIEATRRRYLPGEKQRLQDLFGTPERWGTTVRTFLWTHASAAIGPFAEHTTADLPITCTLDFDVVASKYLYALEEGEVPVNLLFSGSVFFRDDDGLLQTTQVPWDREASYRLPVGAWRDVMDTYYPNAAWLYLHRDTFDRLLAYKTRHGIPTWDAALTRLLAGVEDRTPA